MSHIRGVILAGGRGTRMGPLGEQHAKALLPVANEPVIGHHLRLLASLGARHVHVVIGHRADDFVSVLGDGAAYGVTVEYVEQGPRLGSAHALGRVRGSVRGPFVLLLGDYYFVAAEPERMLRRLHEGVSAIAVKREPDAQLIRDACVSELDSAGRVLNILEKPTAPTTDLKGCGFYALQPTFFDAVARTPRTAFRDEYELTVSLELFIRAGGTLYGEEVIASDTNLTRPHDVLASNVAWLERAGRTSLVGDGASVEDGVRLRRAVVGHGARVEGVTSLEDVVVFPGAHLKGHGEVRKALATSDGIIPCP
jgi:dTDP-glucose pyrophosphorylase